MLQGWPLTFGAAVALVLLGVLFGRALTLRGRRKRERRRGEQPHYLLGLNYLISNQPELALAELSQAVRGETDAVEAYLALGNLFREKGQVERAIDIHKSLLHRPQLTELGRLQALFSLGLDFKKAGLVDRAERTLREVIERDPDNLSGWHCLSKVYEEMGRWEEATEIQRRLQSLTGVRDNRLLASLWTERGRAAWSQENHSAARSHFEAALHLDADYPPAHVGLGDCVAAEGNAGEALDHWERALTENAAWAGEALERIAEACEESGDLERMDRACALVLENYPRSWRAMLVKASLHDLRGESDDARSALTEALLERPCSLTVQRALWFTLEGNGIEDSTFGQLIDRVEREARLVDPYICLRCGFKASNAFARCPHCQEWNTVAEEQA